MPALKNPLLLFAFFLSHSLFAQQITGNWQGRIGKRKVEVKMIQKGDSLTGTTYYYESSKSYRRYSIKGYFDPNTNEAVWWDDQLLEETISRPSGTEAMRSAADFNCPGGGKMLLQGEATPQHSDNKAKVDLTKTENQVFSDEWTFVLDNYTVGANDPYIIDSVALIAYQEPAEEKSSHPQPAVVLPPSKKGMVVIPPLVEAKPVGRPLTIDEKYTGRKRILKTEIPISGDSVELRFYDNAQVDGDSISLYMNDKMLFTHIRLTEKAYVVKLSVKGLAEVTDLTMVAENLGAIPPNTSYMIALVGGKRYEAQLASTEASSAMIRLRKQ